MFEVGENFLRAANDGFRQSREPRDVDPVGTIRRAGNHGAHENDFVVPLAHGDAVIFHSRELVGDARQLVIVRGKKRARTAVAVPVNVFGNGPRDRKSVVSRSAAPDFVENDETFRGSVVENICGFVHFDHERRVPAGKFVGCADAAENSVYDADSCRFCGNPATELREQNDERDLADVGGFARHVRSRDDVDLRSRGGKLRAVRNERLRRSRAAQHLFDDGVATVNDLKLVGLVHFRLAVIPCLRDLRPAGEHVELGERVCGFRERCRSRERFFHEFGVEFGFALGDEFVRLQNFAFLLAKLGSGVALGVDERLPARPRGGNLADVCFRNFDVIAERARVAHAQIANVGFVLKAFFKRDEPRAAVRAKVAQLVEPRVEPAANRAVHVDGQLVFERFGKRLREVGMRIDSGVDGVERRRRNDFERVLDFGNVLKRFANGAEFPRRANAILQTRERAGNIFDVGELGQHARHHGGAFEKRFYAVLAIANDFRVARRSGEPAFEQSCAGSGVCAVDRREQ